MSPTFSAKKHWIIFRKLWTRIFIYSNLFTSKKKRTVKPTFYQGLNKDRPYLVIEESKDKLLILTLTKHSEEENKKGEEDKPSFGRFGPLKCPCLELDTYVILHTKILVTQKFIKESSLDLLTRNNEIKHYCLPEKQFLDMIEALNIYWKKENEQLTLIELGMDSTEEKSKKRMTTPLWK